VRKIAKQTVAHHTFYGFLDDRLPEMVKLLPVAHKQLRKQKVTDMASAPLSIPR